MTAGRTVFTSSEPARNAMRCDAMRCDAMRISGLTMPLGLLYPKSACGNWVGIDRRAIRGGALGSQGLFMLLPLSSLCTTAAPAVLPYHDAVGSLVSEIGKQQLGRDQPPGDPWRCSWLSGVVHALASQRPLHHGSPGGAALPDSIHAALPNKESGKFRTAKCSAGGTSQTRCLARNRTSARL